LHVKVRLAATAAAVAVNPIQLAPASTAWLAVGAAVRAVMAAAAVDLAAVDLAAAMVVAAEVVAVATVAVMAAADLSVAD
jgi:hypothetical protein